MLNYCTNFRAILTRKIKNFTHFVAKNPSLRNFCLTFYAIWAIIQNEITQTHKQAEKLKCKSVKIIERDGEQLAKRVKNRETREKDAKREN